MKTHNLFFKPLACFLLVAFYGQAQNVGVNSTGNAPDASAMLDVSSANKGMLIPQINLTSLTDATTIATPAHSLLVYNTNAALAEGKGYYFNSGTTVAPVWTKLVASGSDWKLAGNTGTTPGTNFIGTTDAQGLVVKTNNTSRMTISSTGVTAIGNGTDQTVFDADGTISFAGAATVFTDLQVPVFSTSNGNSSPPTISAVKTDGAGSQGVFTYFFSANTEQELYFTVQLPHDWKEGSTIYPHIHWLTTTDVGATKVRWGLEYTWVNIASVFGNTTVIYAEDPIAPVGSVTAFKHAITEFAGISGTGKTISSFLICRVFRAATAATDTFTGTAGMLGIDFHIEKDGFGSHTEYTK
ncbi:MAG: hypothetical protein JSS79_02900 [Bacteroidetes bacterium]|nr:hypothetical protein [Bacteroidota bacterium]